MDEGIFFYIKLDFPQKQIAKWLTEILKNDIQEQQKINNNSVSNQNSDIAEINDWLGENSKKYGVLELFEELQNLAQKKKLYFSFTQSEHQIQIEGYFDDEQMGKYFESLLNSSAIASCFQGSGHALFVSNQEAKYRYLNLGVVILPKKFELRQANEILYPKKQGILVKNYHHPILKRIHKNYLNFLKKGKSALWKPEYAGKCGFVDVEGNYILEPNWLAAGVFCNGLAPVSKERGDLWGYIDQKGTLIIKPSFYEAHPFQEGLARVRVKTAKNPKLPYHYGFINTKGTFVIKPTFDYAENFQNGYAKVKFYNKQYLLDKIGFINKLGKIVKNPFSSSAKILSENKTFIQEKNSWYLIDQSGKKLKKLKGKFQEIHSMRNKHAVVKYKNLYGIINEVGEIIILPQFSYAAISPDGPILVQVPLK